LRILLDHNLPRQIKSLLQSQTAREKGWEELINGELLGRAEASGYDFVLTGDRNLGYQNNLNDRKIAIVVVNVTDRRALSHQIDKITAALDQIGPGQYVEVMLDRPALRRRPYPATDL
jgi:hypothetical protein